MTDLRGHVLVVDDLDSNRELFVRLLQKDGLTTDEARDGVEALEMVRTHSYDTILLDVMMPRLDGTETLRTLKQDPRFADIPVIMLSALRETTAILNCIELGADDYLTKPVDRALLKARLTAALRRKQLQDRERGYLTRLQSANERLHELNLLKSRFLAMAAHDLKTPMTTILILADQLIDMEEAGAPMAQQKKSATRIRDSITKMLGTIQSLLDSAAAEGGPLDLQKNPTDLTELVRTVTEDYSIYASSKRIHLNCCIPSESLVAIIDEKRIHEAFENLVSNAIKFSPPNTEVEIVLEAFLQNNGRRAMLRVKDQGPGLTEEDLDKAFNPYQRLSAKPTGGESSTGVGLSIVKQMVELHGSQVRIVSEPGQGAAFSFDLPLEDRP